MKKVITLLVALMLLTSAAFAATTVNMNVQIILEGGELQIAKTSNFEFANVTLSGAPQTAVPSQVPTFQMIDATGDDLGWHVDFDMPEAVSGFNMDRQGTGGDQLALEYATNVATTCTLNSGQAVVNSPTGGPYVVPNGTYGRFTALAVVDTQAGYGKGDYTWVHNTGNYRIEIPGATLAGTYAGTLTATIYQAPN
jgi:hypothetical protein